jgi:hypothetical protein
VPEVSTTSIAIEGSKSNAMEIIHRKSERKPPPRRGKDNPPPGGPRRGNAGNAARPTSATLYSVYAGRDRLGAFRRDGKTFTAFTRLGRPLGVFNSEQAAIAAIDSEAMP